ncbi:MAG TPA: glycosyltransferase [Acidobacteriota bacterium]|nr:glycosyltransferase [Acidobacteriota bacterium]
MEHDNAILIDELMKRGAEVSVATVCSINLVGLFKRYFGIELPYEPKIYSVLPSFMPQFSYFFFNPFMNYVALRKAIGKEKPDVIYVDGLNYKIPHHVANTAKIVVYLNEPVPDHCIPELMGAKLPIYARLYRKMFESFLRLIIEKEPIGTPVCNSEWSSRIYKEFTGKQLRVIKPPVAVEKFYSRKKLNLVTCVGVFTPRKKYERVIQAIYNCQTKPELRIIGSKHMAHSFYLTSLKRLVRHLCLEDRVHFHVDASFDELRDILSHSKICISSGIEYFGIALVEQMASGCVPIVYRASAPWHEIIEHGRYGYGFKTESELADIIDKLLTNESLFRKMSDAAKKRAHAFDQKIFRQKMANLILTRC